MAAARTAVHAKSAKIAKLREEQLRSSPFISCSSDKRWDTTDLLLEQIKRAVHTRLKHSRLALPSGNHDKRSMVSVRIGLYPFTQE